MATSFLLYKSWIILIIYLILSIYNGFLKLKGDKYKWLSMKNQQ